MNDLLRVARNHDVRVVRTYNDLPLLFQGREDIGEHSAHEPIVKVVLRLVDHQRC